MVLLQHLLPLQQTGTKVILTYDEALSATTAATSAFAVTWCGSSNSVGQGTVSVLR